MDLLFRETHGRILLSQSITALQALVWNLSPFFQHSQISDVRHSGEIGWRQMVLFLDHAPWSAELARNRRTALLHLDHEDRLQKESERLKKIYERLNRRETRPPLLPHIRILLARHRNQSLVEPFHEAARRRLEQAGL